VSCQVSCQGTCCNQVRVGSVWAWTWRSGVNVHCSYHDCIGQLITHACIGSYNKVYHLSLAYPKLVDCLIPMATVACLDAESLVEALDTSCDCHPIMRLTHHALFHYDFPSCTSHIMHTGLVTTDPQYVTQNHRLQHVQGQ
jgi:hypothetical protein